jgi:hypothetical protein
MLVSAMRMQVHLFSLRTCRSGFKRGSGAMR